MNSKGDSDRWRSFGRQGLHVWLLFLLPFYPSLLLPFFLLGLLLLSIDRKKESPKQKLPGPLVFALVFSAA